jgi:hypothetical protein
MTYFPGILAVMWNEDEDEDEDNRPVNTTRILRGDDVPIEALIGDEWLLELVAICSRRTSYLHRHVIRRECSILTGLRDSTSEHLSVLRFLPRFLL